VNIRRRKDTFETLLIAQQIVLLVVDVYAQRLPNVMIGVEAIFGVVVGLFVLMQFKALLNVHFHFAQFG
jgi:hypothetical protein